MNNKNQHGEAQGQKAQRAAAILRQLVFVKECKDYYTCPPSGVGEIAIIGRSNAGKSSLINSLAGQKRLARVSSTPGRTQSLVFFTLPDDQGMLVDLPGYGYAKTSREVQNSWRRVIESYLLKRRGLLGLVLLMDCRRSLAKEEWQLARLASARALHLLVVLSKADKLNNGQLAESMRQTNEQLRQFGDSLDAQAVACSVAKGDGPTKVSDWVYTMLGLGGRELF